MRVRRYKSLRPYQVLSLRHLIRNKEAGLFLDMRLGKTLTVLRRFKLFKKPARCLVIAPNSAIGSWEEQCAEENIPYCVLRGTAKQRHGELAIHMSFDNSLVYLMNPEGHRSLPEIKQFDWTAIVLDESQSYMRNIQAAVTRYYLTGFSHVPHRYILTGTPNPESSLEMVPQMLFLHGRFLGSYSYWAIRNRCFFNSPFKLQWVPKKGVTERMQKEIASTCLVMSRNDVGLDVPKVTEKRVIEFSPAVRKAYRELEDDFVLNTSEGPQYLMWAVQKFIALRQMCCGFAGGELMWDGKVEELRSLLLGPLTHEQVIIWFSFTDSIHAVADMMTKHAIRYGVLEGSVTVPKREELRKQFQMGRLRCLLIQEKVGATGMDLSAADTAIYYSEPTSLTTRKQTEDRILKIGKSGLLIISLLVKDSVDEDIHLLLKGKRLSSSMFLKRVRDYAEVRNETKAIR